MNFVCTTCKRDVDTPGHFCPFCGTPAPTPTPKTEDPLVGRKVGGKYFVHQRLGKGGMGLVYKATDVILDRPVALKMLDRVLLSDAGMVQRFHREARAASRLNHPNCITILDFGQLEDGQLFIAMEFLPGRPLTRLVGEEFPIPHRRVVRIGSQILAALAEAHAAGVIHRDLKLSNVMVETRRDEPDFVKVLDFGIAKLVAGDSRSELTTAGMICGTPGYMSPEQARGEELDARSDLYSVGIILYEMLTGRLPFESETPMALAVKHMTETAVVPSLRRPDLAIPPDVDALVMRALAKDREERFASAEDMRAALLDLSVAQTPARGAPRSAVPATMLIPSTPAPQRPRPPAGEDAAPATPERGARPADDAPPAPAARRTPPGAPARPRKLRAGVLAGIAAGATVIVALIVTLVADPFSSPPAQAAVEPELTLPPRPGGSGDAPPPATPPAPTTAAADPVAPPAATAAPADPAAPAGDPNPAPSTAAATEPATAPPAPKPPPKAPRPAAAPPKGIQQVADALGVLKLPPASSGSGLLVVNASPWGQAVVDGKEIGETPKELRVGAGRYRVQVVHPTLGAREGNVLVRPGQRIVFLADFASK